VVVTLEVPGLDRDDLDITVTRDGLLIRGEKREEHEDKRRDFYLAERRYQSFARPVPLPPGLDLDHAEARVKHGVLRIRVPKAAARPGRVSWPR
jgi:HSP20 family protein